jgi:hypothetical protein
MLVSPERLFERSWRPRHPLRRRHCAARRWGMMALLFALCGIIFGYLWLTDVQRVRAMASSYLSDLLGGDVTIGRANLSIFEGLRLDDVTLRVDETNKPDSIIFHARTFFLRYHIEKLLEGKLAATQIIAIDPVVMLVEDPAQHRWNYQRMYHGEGPARRARKENGGGPLVLPQIILRDAEVAYMEMRDGRTVPVGWYSLEGSLNPTSEADRYDFTLQSRGQESMGPSVEGTIRTQGGPSMARMQSFTFGPDIKAMLLAEPRQWCESHELQGRIDVPQMIYTPGVNGGKPTFRAELTLSDVELAVRPQEWTSREQNNRVEQFHQWIDYAEKNSWLDAFWAARLRRLSTAPPVHLRQVTGDLVFTEKGIELKGITGRVENNWFVVDGTIDGYSPDAAASLTISSAWGHDLEIPDLTPDYLASLPNDIQDVIEHLHPQGRCAVTVHVERKEAGSIPQVAGQLDVHDAQFRFADFPYPLTGAKGTILIGPDPIAHMNGIRILSIVAHGLPDGPNANAVMTISGFIGPLDQVAGAQIEVTGTGVSNDPLLRYTLPPVAAQAMELFDPEGEGRLPTFKGSFAAHVTHPVGPHKPWNVDTDLTIDDASATLVSFRYPLEHLTGRLEIRNGYLNVLDVKTQRGDSSLSINGIVTWRTQQTHASNRPFGPYLHIVAHNLPIDDQLKRAVPPLQATWLRDWGATGTVDVDGRVMSVAGPAAGGPRNDTSHVDFAFDVGLRNGELHPFGEETALTDATAKIHIVPTGLTLTDGIGHRGSSVVQGNLSVDWSGDKPVFSLLATAHDLALNDALYQALPVSARPGWNDVNPEGTVDATVSFDSGRQGASGEAMPGKLDLEIFPKDLAITPAAFPWRLDHVQGKISVMPGKVLLTDLTGKHNNAAISFSGEGDLGTAPVWNLKVRADQIDVDDSFIQALPTSVAQVAQALKAGGKIGVEFSRLTYWPNGQSGAGDSTRSDATPGADIDFAAKISMEGASMDFGLPATDVRGAIDLAGLVRNGALYRLAGECRADSLFIAEHPASDFHLSLAKSTDEPTLDLSRLQGHFAGGDVQGGGDYQFPADAPSQYNVNLVLRDADVQQLTAQFKQKISGRLTASLQMAGNWDDANSRRGHGDVSVEGDELYNIPVMFGLLQITNLELPTSSPFSSVSTRYSLAGQKVIFDQIDARSKQTTLSGNGVLDFSARTVSLWLNTNNPSLVLIPVVGPLIHGADQELFKIHVRGTIDQPKVTASTFDTISTTVDQVLNGQAKAN